MQESKTEYLNRIYNNNNIINNNNSAGFLYNNLNDVTSSYSQSPLSSMSSRDFMSGLSGNIINNDNNTERKLIFNDHHRYNIHHRRENTLMMNEEESEAKRECLGCINCGKIMMSTIDENGIMDDIGSNTCESKIVLSKMNHHDEYSKNNAPLKCLLYCLFSNIPLQEIIVKKPLNGAQKLLENMKNLFSRSKSISIANNRDHEYQSIMNDNDNGDSVSVSPFRCTITINQSALHKDHGSIVLERNDRGILSIFSDIAYRNGNFIDTKLEKISQKRLIQLLMNIVFCEKEKDRSNIRIRIGDGFRKFKRNVNESSLYNIKYNNRIWDSTFDGSRYLMVFSDGTWRVTNNYL